MTWLPRELEIDEITELGAPSLKHFLKRPERFRLAGCRTKASAGARVNAIVKRQIEHLDHVEIAGQDERLFPERSHFDTAAAPARSGILEGLALAKLLENHCIRIEDRRKAVTLANDPEGMLQENLRALARELDIGARLEEVHFIDDIEQHVRDFVRAVRPVAQQSSKVDVGEVGVRAALGGSHPDLRGRRDGC